MEKEDTSESPIISNETAKKFKPYCYGLILLIVIGVTTGFAIYFFSGERSYHFSPDDPNSYASTEQFISQNFSLDWFINFEKKQIVGSVTHTFLALQAEQTHLFLDTEKIEVTDVFNEKNQTLEFTLLSDKFASIYGSKLLIILRQPPKVNTTFTITIFYKTHPNATALSWLSPEQTSNKTLNYLFTQCQFIYCRSIIPLQDTPFVKAKYTAKVTVSNPENSNIKYKVFMSANLTNEVHNGENSTYYFTMDIPIPSYLIAIIVGNVEKKKIGKRTSLIAEPNDIEFYAEELAQTDDFLNALEDYLGAYAWGPFNIAVLPPPFPIGGMENPLLTFVSPTIIVGDKSQIWLAIHEMTHSWTGNLVTCKTNEEFWLNEGFTVFIERKITPLFTNESEICNISAHIGNRSMIRDMERFGFDHPFSALVPNLKGRSPTEAYSDVPYEKGFQFLTYLEMKIGLNNFHEFLKQYIDHFSRKSLNSKELKIFFEDFVKKVFPSNSTEILKQIDWNAWLYKPGKIPTGELSFSSAKIEKAQRLAIDFITGSGTPPPASKEFLQYHKLLQKLFLDTLEASSLLNNKIINCLISEYNLTFSKDQIIKGAWFTVTTSANYSEPLHDAELEKYLGSNGRFYLLEYIYKYIGQFNKEKALRLFAKYEAFYPPMTQQRIRAILDIKSF